MQVLISFEIAPSSRGTLSLRNMSNMIFGILVLCISSVTGDQYFYQAQPNVNITTSNSATARSISTSRQYGPPPYTDSYNQNPNVETIFKPNGYTYVSSQKLEFSHNKNLHIYLFQNKLSIYCATDTTYERITWKKYQCPNQVSSQSGETVAVGPMVPNPNLYGVNLFGRNGEFVSELLLKQPLTPQSDGVYVCESTFMSEKQPYNPIVVVRDVIIIGGVSMYQNCFSNRVIVQV